MKRTLPAIGLLILRRLVLFFVIAAFSTALIFMRAGAVVQRGALAQFSWDRYWPALKQYVNHLLHGTWGYMYMEPPLKGGLPPMSPTRTMVADLLNRALPTSLMIFGCALVVGILLGLAGGLLASRFSPTGVRRTTGAVNLALLSLPDLLVIIFVQFGLLKLVNVIGFELLPTYGSWDGVMTLRGLILPVLLLALFPAAYTARLSAAAFDDVFSQEYIRTARAKGVTDMRVTWVHALRNAIIPILSALPAITGILISNLLIVEYAMDIAGVGRLMAREITVVQVGAMASLNYPSPNLLASIAICLAAVFVVIDALTDLALMLLDPRTRDAHQESRSQVAAALMDAGPRPTFGARLAGFFKGLAALPGALVRALLSIRLPDREFWQGLSRAYRWNLPLIFGTLIVAALIFIGIFAPKLAPYEPHFRHTVIMKSAKEWIIPPFPPMAKYPFGTDPIGRDLLSRILYGTRFTLLIALLIVPLRMLIAIPLGLAAGWLRGRWEWFVTRSAVVLGAIPALMIQALLVLTIFSPPRPQTMANPNAPQPDPFLVLLLQTAILVLLGWPRMAESIRLMARDLTARPFVEGARAVGATPARVMFRHILPHLKPTLAVAFAAEVAWVMMLMVQLGVFGVWLGGATNIEGYGLVANYPDWSQMLAYPVKSLWSAPWTLLIPAAAFVIAILGFNLLAEGIRRAQQRLNA